MLKCGIGKAGWAPGAVGFGVGAGGHSELQSGEEMKLEGPAGGAWGRVPACSGASHCCKLANLSPSDPGSDPIAVVSLEGYTQPACESGCWASGSHEGTPRPELPAHSDPEAALFTEDAALHSDPRWALAAAATRTACCAVLCSLAKKMRPSGDWRTRVGTGSKALPPPPPRSLCLSQAPAYASQLLRTNLLYQAVWCPLCHLVH